MNEQTIDQQRFAGGGTKMSALIGARDWSASSLGPLARWPEGLRVVTSLMLETSDPAFIAWGPEFILLYNDGYAELLGPKHPAALGASLDKVWPELWREYRQFAEAAMSGQTTLRRDVPFTLQRGGLDKQVYFTFSISPLRGKDGDVAGLYCTCLETTSEVLARKTLNAEAMQLRELFRQAPGFMTVLRGPDHVFEVVNDAYRRLIGGRDVLGKSVREALPEVAKQGFVQLLDRVLETGEPFIARRTAITLQNTLNEAPEHLILDFVYQPIRDWSGSVTGIFVEGSDVTETARADERVKASERFARATIDSLAEQIAVIDETGQLLEVNAAWREFAAGQGVVPNAVSEQRNYLEDCDKAAAAGDKDAKEIASIIRAVTAGERDWAIWEYARDFVPDKRWFSVKISRFHDDGPVRAVVAHEEITERRKSEQRIQYLATHDELTGLPNRHLLADRAQQAIEHARRSNLGLALLFIDLDNFKYLNDAFGHWVGDSILESVAHELSRLVRAGDTVARIGGDEFVILLSDLPNLLQGATSVSRKLRERFSHPLPLQDRETTVTLSIGVSLFPADGATLDELMRKADAAMYRAKSLGSGAVQFYSAEMSASANSRAILESELRRALRLNQFELYYQPQVLTTTDALVGMEALLRWPHPERGFIAPNKFIPVAEDTGLMVAIGQWVLRTACAQNASWQALGLPPVPVAVNVSAVQLKHPDFPDMVAGALKETRLDPKWLELEVTESSVMSTDTDNIARLSELKATGINIAVDDFGTGYSNLSYLRSFPVDKLKIDQSFVRELPDDAKAVSIVNAILAMARSLGLQVIAEGVETAAQSEFLANAGCEQAQGFYYYPPMAAGDMEAVLHAGPNWRIAPVSAA